MECRHLDGNSLNNNLNNLVWDTHKNNMADTKMHKTSNKGKHYNGGSKHPKVKLTDIDVYWIRWFYSHDTLQKTIAKRFNISESNVSLIVNEKTWRYLEEA